MGLLEKAKILFYLKKKNARSKKKKEKKNYVKMYSQIECLYVTSL